MSSSNPDTTMEARNGDEDGQEPSQSEPGDPVYQDEEFQDEDVDGDEEETQDEQQQEEEQQQEQYNHNNNHLSEDEILRKEKKAKCECYSVVCVAVTIIIIVVVTVTTLAIQNRPAGPMPPTSAPTMAPTIGIADPQLQLDYILDKIKGNNFTTDYVNAIPSNANELQDKYKDTTLDPVVRAASWVVDDDDNNNRDNLIRRFALASIYYSMGGETNWKNTSGWLSDANHCTWYGITCCGGFLDRVAPSCMGPDPGEVVYISLSNNNVTGNITNSFALLKSLQALDLGFNSITGTLPGDMLGSLPNLMSVSLQHNQMTGEIKRAIGKNGVLHTLFVQRNNFEGKWPDAFCYPKLDKFGLDCDKVDCLDQSCCNPDIFCYYDNNSDEDKTTANNATANAGGNNSRN